MGTILDLIIGDPHDYPHPIRMIGNLIAKLEKRLLGDVTERTDRNLFKEKTNGTLRWFLVVTITLVVVSAITILAYALHPYVGTWVEAFLICFIFC